MIDMIDSFEAFDFEDEDMTNVTQQSGSDDFADEPWIEEGFGLEGEDTTSAAQQNGDDSVDDEPWIDEDDEFEDEDDIDFGNLFGMGGQGLFDAIYDRVAKGLGLDELLSLGNDEDDEESEEVEEDLPTMQEVIDDLTLTLFYLTSWEEKISVGDGTIRRAWKSADWDAIDGMRESGLIDCTNKAKSVYLTKEGVDRAKMILVSLGLGHLIDEKEPRGHAGR